MKTAVVTGSSSGIGLVVARELARDGWRVIAQGRNPARAEAALVEIRAAAPQSQVDMLLTHRLLPLLKAAAPGAQVITTASVAHKFIRDMKWDDLQQVEKFSANDAYTQSKLANILFTREMAKRVEQDGIRVNCMHPGVVQTNFDSNGNLAVKLMYFLGKPFSLTPEKGADTILWLARGGAPDATGQYFAKRKPGELTPAAQSDEGAARLWRISEDLVDKAGQPVS